MTTYYGVNRTKILAGGPTTQTPETLFGKVVYIYDKYTGAGEAAGSIIEMGPDLNKGQRIIDWAIDHAALGSGTTLKLGTYADDDSLMAAVSCASAGVKTADANGVTGTKGFEVAGVVTPGAEDNKLIITTGVNTITGLIILSMLVASKG